MGADEQTSTVVLVLNFSAKFGLIVFKIPRCGNTQNVGGKPKETTLMLQDRI